LDRVNDRKVILLVVLLAALVASGCKKSGHEKFLPYGVQHARMHFEFLGSSRGYEDLFVDSFGVYEAHFVHQDMVSSKDVKTVKLLVIKRGSELAVTDSMQMAQSLTKDTRLDSLYKLSSGDAPGPEEEFASFFKEGRFHKIADTTVLGLKANLWQQAEDPVYIIEWRGIVIGRKVTAVGPEMELKLVSVDTTSPIDPKIFIAPTGLPPMPARAPAATRRPQQQR
jgi:hypothetical protein